MKRFYVGAISFLLSLGLIGACVHVAQAQPRAVTDKPIMRLSKKGGEGLEEGKIEDLQYSPDGRYLAIRSWRRIELRDAKSLEIVTTLDVHINKMQFSPNSKVLVLSGGRRLELWSVQTGQRMKSLPVKAEPRQISFSPDSAFVVAAIYKEGVKIWEVQTGRVVFEERDVNSFQFSPDGRFFAAEGWIDGRDWIKVWEVRTWKEVSTFE